MIKKIISNFFIIMVFAYLCVPLAHCQEAVLLEKDQPSPYRGFLLPEEKVQELYKSAKKLEDELEINKSLEKSIELHKKNEEIYVKSQNLLLEQNQKLGAHVAKDKGTTTFTYFLMFGGGVAATGALPVGGAIAGVGLLVWAIESIF